MELGRIAQRDTLDKDILTIGKSHEMGSHLFLRVIRCRNIGKMLQVEGIPQLAIGRNGASHRFILIPFGVAHLATLHRSPVFAVAINNAFAGHRDVLTLGGGESGFGFVVSLTIL